MTPQASVNGEWDQKKNSVVGKVCEKLFFWSVIHSKLNGKSSSRMRLYAIGYE